LLSIKSRADRPASVMRQPPSCRSTKPWRKFPDLARDRHSLGAFRPFPDTHQLGGVHFQLSKGAAWIAPDQSVHTAKAILQDLTVNGYQIVKKGKV
jgi:hypothetical protein